MTIFSFFLIFGEAAEKAALYPTPQDPKHNGPHTQHHCVTTNTPDTTGTTHALLTIALMAAGGHEQGSGGGLARHACAARARVGGHTSGRAAAGLAQEGGRARAHVAGPAAHGRTASRGDPAVVSPTRLRRARVGLWAPEQAGGWASRARMGRAGGAQGAGTP